MPSRPTQYRTYDVSTRLAFLKHGDADGIPRSTLRYWRQKGLSGDSLSFLPIPGKAVGLRNRVKSLEDALAILQKIMSHPDVRQVWSTINEAAKKDILEIVSSKENTAPKKLIEKSLGMGLGRLRSWTKRSKKNCDLSSSGACQKRWHSSLTPSELATLKHLHTSQRFSHFSIRSLSFYAKREKLLFCSASTWQQQAKKHGWKRPFPYKSRWKKRNGLRVSQPNELWHVDTTYFKMGNGNTLYFQAVVDNHSRCILAWKSALALRGINTVQLLKAAKSRIESESIMPHLLMDRGPENKNVHVEGAVRKLRLKRMFAGVDIKFSNSIVESVFRSLKGRFLGGREFFNERDLRASISRFVHQHNEVVPHAALGGATPLEVQAGAWRAENRKAMADEHLRALSIRKKVNRSYQCHLCPLPPVST